MYILPRIKKIAACSLAIIMTFGAFGLTKNENTFETYAVKDQSQYAQKLSDLSDKQKELEKKIANADDSIKEQEELLNDVADQMSVISEKIKVSEKYSKQIEDDMCKLDEKMRDTEMDLSDKEEEITKNVNSFMKRVRAMYVSGTDSYTSILADSADFYDVLMRTELIKKVAEHDNETINSLIEQKKTIDTQKEKLEKQSEELKSSSKEYAEQQKTLSEEYQKLVDLKESYGASIEALKNDKSEYQGEIDKVIEEYSDAAAQAEENVQQQADNTSDNKSDETSKTAASTTKKNSDNSKSENQTTTTKKSSGNSESTTAKQTTTTKAKTTAADTTKKTEAATTTKKAATTTTAKKTTTTKKTTVATTSSKTSGSSSSYDSKIGILMSTAKSMVGGSYVWGAASPRATDCSGLTMQCYAKIGISLPHKASSQANYGTSVSFANMKKGDLIFFGGSSYSSIYHVAIYIGDGKMIHAENTYTGIVVSYVSSFSKYNNITCIKRLI